MYFDYQDKLLVCTIDKVMSTTFLAHFKKLAQKRKPNFIKLETMSHPRIIIPTRLKTLTVIVVLCM